MPATPRHRRRHSRILVGGFLVVATLAALQVVDVGAVVSGPTAPTQADDAPDVGDEADLDGNAPLSADAVTIAEATDGVAPVPSDIPLEDVDLNQDGHVDQGDITAAQIAWRGADVDDGACRLDPDTAAADVDGNGCIQERDLGLIAGQFSARAAAAPPANPAIAADIVVDTNSDDADVDYHDGRCLTAAGTCSLRAAITQANAAPGPDRIVFAIPGSGTHTIKIAEKLPDLYDLSGGTSIDGYTQPGAAPNAHPTRFDATIKIQIQAAGSDKVKHALTITSADNHVQGLAIYGAQRNLTIAGADADRNRIVGNILSTNAADSYTDATKQGQYVGGVWLYVGASENQIGAPTLAERNLLAGDTGYALMVEQGGTDNNVIQNNLMGTDRNGVSIKVARVIDIQWYPRNTIVGGVGVLERNLIAGGGYVQIDISHTPYETKIIGNLIGSDASGTAINPGLPATNGINIKDSATDTVIADNVIVGVKDYGIYSRHNYNPRQTIVRNRIGVTTSGAAAGSGKAGIYVNGHDSVVADNTIAHTNGPAIAVVNVYPGDNDVHTNYPAGRTERNTLTNNRFIANTGMSIDIAPDGPNANDGGDGDGGPNTRLNHPTATATGDTVTGTACASCTVEIYAVADGHASVRLASVRADESGTFAHSDPAVGRATGFSLIATDPAGNTSEDSPVVAGAADPFPSLAASKLFGATRTKTIQGTRMYRGTTTKEYNRDGFSGTTERVRFVLRAPVAGRYRISVPVYAPYTDVNNAFWLRVDGGKEYVWKLDVSSKVYQADSRVLTLKAGQNMVEFAPFTFGVAVGAAKLVPYDATVTLDAIADHTSAAGVPASLAISSSDALDTTVGHSAIGLPSGTSIDPITGVIAGAPDLGGTYDVTVTAEANGTRINRTFIWHVTTTVGAPVIAPLGRIIGTSGDTATTTIPASDPNGDRLRFSATDLPPGITLSADGVLSGTYLVGGTHISTVTATDTTGLTATRRLAWDIAAGVFACSVDGTTLRWTNGQSGTAYIGWMHDGASAYLGAVDTPIGSGSLTVSDTVGTFEVHYYNIGHIETTCDGQSEAPTDIPGVFECRVDAATATLTWNDGQAGPAYVGLLDAAGNADRYIGASDTGSIAIPDIDGSYEVHYYTDGHIQTTCPT